MSDIPITLIDASGGSAQEKNAELGKFRAQQFQVIESLDPATQRARVHDGFFQPRNFHVAEGDPLDPSMPKIIDRRFSIQLVIDRREFGAFKDVADPLSKYSSLKGDWPAQQHSTRIIDGTDPKGNGALLPSAFRVIDDHKSAYSLAWELNRETASAKSDTDTIAAGYVYDATNKAAGYLDSVLVVNPKDSNATGKDGTKCGIAGIPTDAHFEYVPPQGTQTTSGPKGRRAPIDKDKHGAIKFDPDADISGAAKGFMGLDKSVTPPVWVPTFGGSGGSTNFAVQSFDFDLTITGGPYYNNGSGYGNDCVAIGAVPITGPWQFLGSAQKILTAFTMDDSSTPDYWVVYIGNNPAGWDGFSSLGGVFGNVNLADVGSARIQYSFPNHCQVGAECHYIDAARGNLMYFNNHYYSNGQVDTPPNYYKGSYLYLWAQANPGTAGKINGGRIKGRIYYLQVNQVF